MDISWKLNETKYVGLINYLSDSIYKYSSMTISNINMFVNFLNSLDDELNLGEEIEQFIFSFKSNLTNFYSEVKLIVKNLRETRKKYLNNILNYFNYITSENKNLKNLLNKPRRNISQNTKEKNYNSFNKYKKSGNNMKLSLSEQKIFSPMHSSEIHLDNKNIFLSDNDITRFSSNAFLNYYKNEKEKENNSLKKENLRLKGNIIEFRNVIEDIKKKHKLIINDYRKKNEKNNNIIKMYKSKLFKLENEIKYMKIINNKMKKMLKKFNFKSNSLSTDLENKKNELESIKINCNSLLNMNKNLDIKIKENALELEQQKLKNSELEELKNKNIDKINTQESQIKELQNLLNEKEKRIKNLEKNDLENKKKNESINLLFEEENKKIKSENEELKIQNDELKKEIENKKDKVKCLTITDSNYEEEYNMHDLAKSALDKNNSEDLRIDFPALNIFNNKNEELKKNFKELKEIFDYIISHTQCEDPDIKQKTIRACQILEINLE